MFCSKCGAQLENSACFCPSCGCAQAAVPPAQPTPPVPSFAKPAESGLHFSDKVRSVVRKAGSSPSFLAAAICYTLAMVFSFLSWFGISDFWVAYSGLEEEFQLNTPEILATLENGTLIAGLIGMIPSILIATGLWITYGNCVSRKNRINTAGMSMIFVVSLVQMVLSCLIFLGALILVGVVYLGAPNLFGPEAQIVEILLLAAGLVLLAAFSFALIYYIQLCSTISTVRGTLQTGIPNKKVSRFVAVMCCIGGVMMVFSGIENIKSAGVAALGGIYEDAVYASVARTLFLSGIATLLAATAQILFGVLIFSYRGKMTALEAEERLNTYQTLTHAEPYASPVYIPPQITEEAPAAEEPVVIEEPQAATPPATDE